MGVDKADAALVHARRLPRFAPYLATVVIFGLLSRRVPFSSLVDVLRHADYVPFLALMGANTVFYFLWDTLLLSMVMRWFHQPVPFRELLPARAASYVSAIFNTNLARGTLTYLLRGAPTRASFNWAALSSFSSQPSSRISSPGPRSE